MIEELSTSAQNEHEIVHILIICDSPIKMVIHTASMRSAKAFEVFQHWTSDRNYTENTWDSVLTTPQIEDASD